MNTGNQPGGLLLARSLEAPLVSCLLPERIAEILHECQRACRIVGPRRKASLRPLANRSGPYVGMIIAFNWIEQTWQWEPPSSAHSITQTHIGRERKRLPLVLHNNGSSISKNNNQLQQRHRDGITFGGSLVVGSARLHRCASQPIASPFWLHMFVVLASQRAQCPSCCCCLRRRQCCRT